MTNLDVIRKAYQEVGSGDMEALLALCDDEVTWVVQGAAGRSGAYQGVDGVREMLARTNELVSLHFHAPREFIDAGDKVVVLGEAEGKLKETGEPFKHRWVNVFTMKGGRITTFRSFVCRWLGGEAPPPITWQ